MRWNISVVATVMISVSALTSCANQREALRQSEFPGFEQVSEKGDGSSFLVDPSSISAQGNGAVQFRLLQLLPGGYAIQNASVTADNQFVSEDGTKYQKDGTAAGTFSGISTSISDSQKGLMSLAEFVRAELAKRKSFSGSFDDSKALQALYGQYRPDLGGCLRKDVQLPGSDEVTPQATAHVFLSREYESHGETKHLLLIATNTEDNVCHACAPLIDAAIFTHKNGSWLIERQFNEVQLPAQYGKPPDCSWDRIGQDQWALVVNNMDGGQGIYHSDVIVISLEAPEPKAVLSFSTEYNDSENSPKCQLSFKTSSKAFWDGEIGVTYPKKPGHIDRLHYTYSNGTYDTQDSIPQETAQSEDVPGETETEPKTGLPPEPPTEIAPDVPSSNERARPVHTNKKPHATVARKKPIQTNDPLDPRLFLDH